ncbi:hypothetical protein B0H14DRAFT_3861986, partial [Mycena olivaceomarginata]
MFLSSTAGPTASKYTRLLPLPEPFRALHRQLYVPSHRRAHVFSDHRSHSSYVVDRPTTSAFSSPTTNFSCDLYLRLCEYRQSAAPTRSRIALRRLFPPRALCPAPHNRNT